MRKLQPSYLDLLHQQLAKLVLGQRRICGRGPASPASCGGPEARAIRNLGRDGELAGTGTLAGADGGASYRIPTLWNNWGYQEARAVGRGEVAVDPYRFALACIERIILPARGIRRLAGRSLSHIRGVRRAGSGKIRDDYGLRRGGDWIRSANIYGMLIRVSTAWDHNGDGRLEPGAWTETGTFLKAIWLLPLLARMGIEVIYLLPINKIGRAFRKGEIGCPYSAKNFFEFDPALHDKLLDQRDAARIEARGVSCGIESHRSVEVEAGFGAFVEAAHAMDMRVMIDLAPRTASRDSDLILEHPDWFYWIDAGQARGYGPPYLEGCPRGIPKRSELAGILNRDIIREHLAKFRFAPNVTDPRGWKRFVARCRAQESPDILRGILREFGVVTPPGFSDVLNDPQPPWSDVTFLRLFLDHPAASSPHLDDPTRQPPYVLTDTIKASKFPGRQPNMRLWKFLSDILPFYQRFGVDGARVDMGHALPPGLQRMIIEKPKRRDPDFSFMAEELDYQGGPAAKRDGYNAIIGSSWGMMPRHAEGELHRFAYDVLPAAVLPALAAAETPDTPRAVVREGGKDFARLTAVLSNFLPSAIPFVHGGLELLERQPLNLGLDPLPGGQYSLPRHDPYFGKLGYFDRVALHWANAGAADMIGLLAEAASLRRRFLSDLAKARNAFTPQVAANHRWIIAVGWRVERRRRVLLVVANLDFRRQRQGVIDLAEGVMGAKFAGPAVRTPRLPCAILLEIKSGHPPPRFARGKLRLSLEPGDVKALLLG